LVPSITLTEVFRNILRQRDEESALAAIADMKHGKVIPLYSELAIDAGNYGIALKLPQKVLGVGRTIPCFAGHKV